MSAPTRGRSPDRATAEPAQELVGSTRTVHYDVTGDDSVRCLAGRSIEFLRKPDVVASARVIELAEWPCMEAVRETISAHECSLGVRQRLDHRAPIAIGAHLAITACCTVARHPYSEWQVSVHDGHEDVAFATLAFVVVDRAEFEMSRLSGKTPPPCGAVRNRRARELNTGCWT